jgi:dolichol kinase
MIPVRSEIIFVLILAGIYSFIFLLGEFIRCALPSKPELSRKSVHFLSGLTALSLPYVIKNHWWVLTLGAVFLAIVLFAKQKGALKSIHNIERESYGAYIFPVTVYVLFLLSHEKPVLYFVPILIMTVSDTLAALVGDKYGSIKFEVKGTTKSLEGSTAFFFSAFLCLHLSLPLMTTIDRIDSVFMAFTIALLVTGFEAISARGTDNFSVPLGTYFLLAKMTQSPLTLTVEPIVILLVLVIVTVVLLAGRGLFIGEISSKQEKIAKAENAAFE